MPSRGSAIKGQVKGFLIPIFTEPHPVTGEQRAGLSYDDFQKVVEGFACAKCLAEFDHYTVVCPACGLQRDLSYDLETSPEIWQQHINERNQDVPTPRNPIRNPLVALDQIRNDKDVEQLSLSKLKGRRRAK